jgi:hypothetical protein
MIKWRRFYYFCAATAAPSVSFAYPEYIRTKTVTEAICGIKDYGWGSSAVCPANYLESRSASCTPIVSQDPSCGVAREIMERQPQCGVEVAKQGTSFTCGSSEEEFWSEWGSGCDNGWLHGAVGVVNGMGQSETRVTREGLRVFSQDRQRCKGSKPSTCRHESFGVELFRECSVGQVFNSCVVAYEACRHPSHGVESYQTCQDISFGINYNTCSIPDVDVQKEALVSIETQINTYLLAINTILNSALAPKTKTLLGTIMATLQQSLATVDQNLTGNNARIAATADAAEVADLNIKMTQLTNSKAQIEASLLNVSNCLFGKIPACVDSYDGVIAELQLQLDSQLIKLKEIKAYLVAQDLALAGNEDALRAKIAELLALKIFEGV